MKKFKLKLKNEITEYHTDKNINEVLKVHNCEETIMMITNTTQNAVISRSFLVWKFCGNVQFRQSLSEILRKFPHQEIR